MKLQKANNVCGRMSGPLTAKQIFYSLLEETEFKSYIDKLIEIRPYKNTDYVEFIVEITPVKYLHLVIDLKKRRLVEAFETDFFHS